MIKIQTIKIYITIGGMPPHKEGWLKIDSTGKLNKTNAIRNIDNIFWLVFFNIFDFSAKQFSNFQV